jgi:hypothetical protein
VITVEQLPSGLWLATAADGHIRHVATRRLDTVTRCRDTMPSLAGIAGL